MYAPSCAAATHAAGFDSILYPLCMGVQYRFQENTRPICKRLHTQFGVDFVQVNLTHRHFVCGVVAVVFEKIKVTLINLMY